MANLLDTTVNGTLDVTGSILQNNYKPLYYDIGDIYITVNPNMDTAAKVAAKLGGAWEAFAPGRTLVGLDAANANFNTIKKTGGEETHVLSLAEMPAHNHGSAGAHTHNVTSGAAVNGSITGLNSYASIFSNTRTMSNAALSNGAHTHTTQGSGSAHNNLQPYITVYMWIKTA